MSLTHTNKHVVNVTQNRVNPMPILCLDDFMVQRGEFVLCDNVVLTLKSGQICHLIGANGTGKTTLLMQLAGLLPVTNGEVTYQGRKSLPIQPLYVSHQLGIHPNLTVAQNLTFLLNLYGISPSFADIDKALTWAGLAGYETVNSSELSAGQTRRITLARLNLMSVEHAPLWLLDEPFTALDVDMVARLERRMQSFVKSGGAVLMTSHQAVQVANSELNLSEFIHSIDGDYLDDDNLNDDDLNDDDLNDNELDDNNYYDDNDDNMNDDKLVERV